MMEYQEAQEVLKEAEATVADLRYFKKQKELTVAESSARDALRFIKLAYKGINLGYTAQKVADYISELESLTVRSDGDKLMVAAINAMKKELRENFNTENTENSEQ